MTDRLQGLIQWDPAKVHIECRAAEHLALVITMALFLVLIRIL